MSIKLLKLIKEVEKCEGVLSINRGWELWNASVSKDGEKNDYFAYGRTMEEVLENLLKDKKKK